MKTEDTREAVVPPADGPGGWQSAWPTTKGAWWFYGRLPGEDFKTLIVVIVGATADTPPKYFAMWIMNFWLEGQIEGKWLKIETPVPPED